MSGKISGLVWDLDLPQNEKFVLLAYADHADHNGNNIFPAVKLIMQKTGYSERSVQSITRKLEKRGLLIADGKGPKGTNRYKYGGAIPAPAKSAGVQSDVKGVQHVAERGAIIAAPEPSLTVKEPSIKREPDLVDAILEQERINQEKQASNETYPHREKFPEPIRELIDVYVKLTGQRPLKSKLNKWLMDGQDWLDLGALKTDVENAYKRSKPDKHGGGGFAVTSPGSLTNVLGMVIGERRTGGNGHGPQIDYSEIERTRKMLADRDKKYNKPSAIGDVMKGMKS